MKTTEDPGFPEDLAAAKQGDDAALERVLLTVQQQLRAIIDRRLGERLRAQVRNSDVLQNAYLTLIRKIPEFEGDTETEFVAWVSVIVEHDIKRQNRWFRAKKRHHPSTTSEKNALAKVLLPPVDTPSQEVMRQESWDVLLRAMDELPEDYREVLELAWISKLSRTEIAERIGRSPTATRMLLFRARAALAVTMERLDPSSPNIPRFLEEE
ncbi:MAG: sigma-70 family RNA polymerase sigma factor [Planctomycetes bacterium]|nr:sigma-70 family RNA polymerase sigma factor [Planctomycetota bacterium]